MTHFEGTLNDVSGRRAATGLHDPRADVCFAPDHARKQTLRLFEGVPAQLLSGAKILGWLDHQLGLEIGKTARAYKCSLSE
jgi:hypothetical protein